MISTDAIKLSKCRVNFKCLSEIFAIIASIMLPLSTAGLEFFFLASVICCAFSADWRKHYQIVYTNRLACMVVIFFALFVVGTTYSIASWPEILHTLGKYKKYPLGIFLFSIFRDQKTRQYAFVGFLCATSVTSLFSYLKFFGWGVNYCFKYASCVFKDHIANGLLLAFSSYTYAVFAIANKKWRLVFCILCFLASYNVLFINLGRSGYVVFFSLLLLLGWQNFSWKGLIIAVVLSCFLLSSTLLLSSNFNHRLHAVHTEISQYNADKKDTSIGLRLSFYKNSWHLLAKHLWVGTGTGSFSKVYASVIEDNEWPTANPHNEYLNIAVQFGLLGIIVLLALFLFHWQMSFSLEEISKKIAQATVIAIATGCLFNSWLMDITQGTFYIFFAALCFSTLSNEDIKIRNFIKLNPQF